MGSREWEAIFCCVTEGQERQVSRLALAAAIRGAAVVCSKVLVEIIIEHLGAGLSTMSEDERSLRSDRAGLGLASAEGLRVGDGCLGRRQGVTGADESIRLRRRSAARQQDQNDREPEHHSKQEPHQPALEPRSGLTAWIGSLATTLETSVGSRRLFLPIFDANVRRLFRKFEH